MTKPGSTSKKKKFVSQAPSPPHVVRGSYVPRSSKCSLPPDSLPASYPSSLVAATDLIIVNAIEKFPLQSDVVDLCKCVVAELTPLISASIKSGELRQNLAKDRMLELIRLLVVHNCEHQSREYELENEVRSSKEWASLVKAIADTQTEVCTKAVPRVESDDVATELRKAIIEANRVFSKSLLPANHQFWTNIDSEDSSEINRQYFEPHEREWLNAVKVALNEAFPRVVAAASVNHDQAAAIELALTSLRESLEEHWKPDEIIDVIATTSERKLPLGASRYVNEYSRGLKEQILSHVGSLARRMRLSFSDKRLEEKPTGNGTLEMGKWADELLPEIKKFSRLLLAGEKPEALRPDFGRLFTEVFDQLPPNSQKLFFDKASKIKKLNNEDLAETLADVKGKRGATLLDHRKDYRASKRKQSTA